MEVRTLSPTRTKHKFLKKITPTPKKSCMMLNYLFLMIFKLVILIMNCYHNNKCIIPTFVITKMATKMSKKKYQNKNYYKRHLNYSFRKKHGVFTLPKISCMYHSSTRRLKNNGKFK